MRNFDQSIDQLDALSIEDDGVQIQVFSSNHVTAIRLKIDLLFLLESGAPGERCKMDGIERHKVVS